MEKSFYPLFLNKKWYFDTDTLYTAQWWTRSCTTILLFHGEKRSTLKSENFTKILEIRLFQKVANFWCLSLQVLAKETTLPKPREDPEGLLGSGRTLWSCAGSVKMSTWNKSLFTLARSNFTYFVFTKTRPGSTVFENHRKGLVQHCEVRLSWVDKSSLKMPKIVEFESLKLARSNSVTRQATKSVEMPELKTANETFHFVVNFILIHSHQNTS